MTANLLISPPATGKTERCIERARAAGKDNPLAEIWFLVPDAFSAEAMRRRLAAGGAWLPLRVATFPELYREILERAGRSQPLAGTGMLRRLFQETIRTLGEGGRIPHFASIHNKPGFRSAIQERVSELKRALVTPERLAEAAGAEFAREDAGLHDLACIYAAFQTRLDELGWVDIDGLAWRAHEALRADKTCFTEITFLAVDGFDQFNPAQLVTLQMLAERAAETWITLPGEVERERPAQRRSAAAAKSLRSSPAIKILAGSKLPEGAADLPPTLRHLEGGLFETGAGQINSGADLTRIEASSPAEEAREALRWIKALVVREGVALSACAIAVPQTDAYRAPLQDCADEFGIPIQFSQNHMLAATPLGAAIADLLRLALHDYPLRPLLDTIRSPYFNLAALGLAGADAKPLEIASRYGQVVQGISQWEAALLALAAQEDEDTAGEDRHEEELEIPRLPKGKAAGRLWNGLKGLADLLCPPPGTRSYQAWALWLQELFENLGVYEILVKTGEAALADMLDRLLYSLARSEALTGPCPTDYAGFLNEWAGLMEAIPLAENEEEEADGSHSGLRVFNILEARRLRVDALAVLGLAEGVFPAVERTDPFLSERLREELGMESALGGEQAGLFYQLVTRARRNLLLIRPYLAKDGETWEVSPYWNAVQELLLEPPLKIQADAPRPLNEAASSVELLFWAARRRSQAGTDLPEDFRKGLAARWAHLGETQRILADRLSKEEDSIFDGDLSGLSGLLRERFGERAGWSASRLESYASCPFSFLATSGLGLEVIEAPQVGYQVNQLGSILHEVLEQVYPAAQDPADAEDVLAHLAEVAGRVFAAAPLKYGFRPSPLWEMEQTDLLLVLEQTIRAIAALDAEGGWKPRAYEAKFGLEGKPALILPAAEGNIRLHGVIDRVDANRDGQLRVIDYKSGSAHLSAQDLLDGTRLQLPIYALAASQALGLGEVREGFYWKLFQGEVSSLRLSQFQCESGSGPQAAFALAAGYIADIVSRIRRGAFTPHPPANGCPEYCPAASWCWQYHAENRPW